MSKFLNPLILLMRRIVMRPKHIMNNANNPIDHRKKNDNTKKNFPFRIGVTVFYISLFLIGIKISENFTANAQQTSLIDDTAEKEALKQAEKDSEEKTFFLGGQDDIKNLSSSEVRILYQLTKRRKELQERESILLEREAFIEAAEKSLGLRFNELNKLQNNISTLLARYDEIQINENNKLRQIYSAMKPKDAAVIFNDLDIETLLMIVAGMKPRNVAPIIAAMDQERARIVTKQIADNTSLAELRSDFNNILGENNNPDQNNTNNN